MATKTSTPTADASESFREMDRDVEDVGAHCQLEYCGIRDFLPFKCESCKGTFCLDHRTETAHQCTKAGEWARRRNAQNSQTNGSLPPKPSLLTHDKQCSEIKCKTLIGTSRIPVNHCTTCNRNYCLSHRMPEDHNCKNLVPIGARPKTQMGTMAEARKAATSGLSRFRQWIGEKREEEKQVPGAKSAKEKENDLISSLRRRFTDPSKITKAQAIANLNDLKRTAKGEANIPQQKRIYMYVEAETETAKAKFSPGKFFYNREWSVGRMLDAAAKAMQVENVNNRGGGEEEKLRVFHLVHGFLNFSDKVGDCCKTGDKIVLMRGVKDPLLMVV